MRRTIVLIASIAIIASIPAVAAEYTNKDINASRTRLATVSSQQANAADNEKACRAYAASFYESVTRRQAIICAPPRIWICQGIFGGYHRRSTSISSR
jgi:hypothetical protein